MQVHSDWYDGIARQINQQKGTLSKKDYKKHKLGLLLCLAGRADSFSAECSECQTFQHEITELTRGLDDLPEASKEKRNSYNKTINKIVSHIRKQHNLTTRSQNFAIWITVGVELGLLLGAGMGKIAGGMPFGIGLGMTIGLYLDVKLRKEGRLICPPDTAVTTRLSKFALALLVIAGFCFLIGLAAAIDHVFFGAQL